MPYVSPEDILQAKQMDLLTYLQNYEPNELVRISANTYCTREHDSLKISNGKWNWFSRGFGGTTALDYLVRVKGYSFIQAVETILGRSAVVPPVTRQAPVKVKPRVLLLPEQNPTADRVVRYLRGRGIHPVIIDHCLRNRTLYESAKYHSAVFIGRDKEGQARYAAIRGTKGSYKGEATGSDKHYSFSIAENPASDTVHVFESAIDLMSFATLQLFEGTNWRNNKPYSEQSRTYVVSSNNKAYQAGMGGYSIYASCLDGTDPCVRLESYMAAEKGGANGWKIERCYTQEQEREMIDIIAGPCFICDCSGESFGSLNEEQQRKYTEMFKKPERFFMKGDAIKAVPYTPEKIHER